MSDILLFKIKKNNAVQLNKSNVNLEKNLQELIQNNLEKFFGIEFLATEYFTEKSEGRIDTLGIDEDGSPVIIEYKRSMEKGMLEQILSYNAWLENHKLEFEKLVDDKRKKKEIKHDKEVDWTSPRLLCIAEDFNKRFLKAVTQVSKKIQIMRYQMYENEYILFELIGAKRTKLKKQVEKSPKKGVEIRLEKSSDRIKKLFSTIDSYIINLGDDVNKKILKQYFAYTKIRNFVCLLVYKESIRLYLKIDPSTIIHIPNITRDVTEKGHYGTGDLEITIKNENDLEQVKTLIEKSYLGS